MTDLLSAPDAEAVLAGLKDFQRRHRSEYVFGRLYLDQDRVRRFS